MSEAEELASITGLAPDQAALLLEAAGGDLAIAVQLHFDGEDARGRPGNSAADEAAARAAQMEEDAANYGGGLGDDDDDDDDDGFPEPVPDEGRDGGAGAAVLSPGGRRAHSPGAVPRGGPPQPGRLTRLCAAFGWFATAPGFSLIYRVLLGGGRFLYSTGLIQLVTSLLWAPLAMLGLVAAAPPPPPPAVAAQRFEAWFEEHHGQTHPPFFRGSCQSALGRSRSEAKFVLVYLHDTGADESVQFCDRVLASARFAAFAAEHFVLWVGDLSTPEGRAIRRALRAPHLPTVVVLAHGEMAAAMGGGLGGGLGGGGPLGAGGGGGVLMGGDRPAPVQALGSCSGTRALNEEQLIGSLQGILDTFEPLLVAARAEQNERLMDRMMREQQEEEYARALAEDQAREAAEAEAAAAATAAAEAAAAAQAAAAEEAAQAEAAVEAKRNARLAKDATLPPEPAAGSDATRLVIKLADGRRLDRRFAKECALQAAIDLIESTDPDIYDGADFDLVSNYPRKVFGRAMFGESLEALGLHPSATLFTKEADDD